MMERSLMTYKRNKMPRILLLAFLLLINSAFACSIYIPQMTFPEFVEDQHRQVMGRDWWVVEGYYTKNNQFKVTDPHGSTLKSGREYSVYHPTWGNVCEPGYLSVAVNQDEYGKAQLLIVRSIDKGKSLEISLSVPGNIWVRNEYVYFYGKAQNAEVVEHNQGAPSVLYRVHKGQLFAYLQPFKSPLPASQDSIESSPWVLSEDNSLKWDEFKRFNIKVYSDKGNYHADYQQ